MGLEKMCNDGTSIKTNNCIPSIVVTEKPTGKLRIKNGKIQEAIQVDRIDHSTNAYNVYLEWRNLQEADMSAPDVEIMYQSDNWKYVQS